MGIVFRQSVKTTIVVFLGALLGAMAIYLSTRYIPKQPLGFIRNLTNQATVIGQILLLGAPYTMSVYVHRYQNNDERKRALISLSFVVPFIIFAVLIVFYYLFRDSITHWFRPQDIPFISRYYHWLPVFILLVMFHNIMELYMNSQMKIALSSFMREVVLKIINIVLIVLLWYGYISFPVFVGGTVLAVAVPFLVLLAFATRTENFGFSFNRRAFSSIEYKELTHFAWYHALIAVSAYLIGFLDTLMLATLAEDGLRSVAVYTIAVFIVTVIQLPNRAMINSVYPILAKAYEDKDLVKVEDIFRRSAINILIVSVAVAVIICCSLHNVVTLMKKGYEAITPLVLIMLIARGADILTGINDQILSLSRHYKFSFYMSMGLVVLMIALNFILIPLYGMFGAAWSTTLAVVAFNIAKYFFVWVKLGLQPLSKGTLKVLFAGCIAFIAGNFIPYVYGPVTDTLARTGVVALVYLTMILWLRPSPDVTEYIASIRRNKRLF